MNGGTTSGGPSWRGPLPGESLNGYLAYRASHALMPGPFAITVLGGAVHANYPGTGFGDGTSHDGLLEIAASLGVPVAQLRSRAHPLNTAGRRRFASTEIDGRLIEKRTRRYSPASLVASPHHRACWALRCLPFCEESWETLVDRCPAAYCGAVQRWRRSSGPDRCDVCGEHLATAATDVVPHDLRAPLRSLFGLMHDDPGRVAEGMASLDPALSAARPGGVLEAACAVAGLIDPAIRHRSVAFIASDAPPLRVAAAMAAAWRSLQDWPRSGALLAGDRLAARCGRFGDGNDGATFAFVGLAEDRAAGDVARAVADMLRRELRSNRDRGVPIKEAVVRTGLKASGLADLRRRAGVDTAFHLVGNDRVVPLIAHSSLARLRAARADGRAARAVAKVLGTTHDGVEGLLGEGLLRRSDGRPAGPLPPFGLIDTKSVDRLVALVASAANRPRDLDWISLATASRRIGGDLKPWSGWFVAILDGRIGAHLVAGDAPLTARTMLAPNSVAVLRTIMEDADVIEEGLSPMLSRTDAGATLNLRLGNHEAAFAPWPVPYGRSPCVPLREVRRLASQWIAAGEIGSLLGTSPQRACRLLEAAGRTSGPMGYGRSEIVRMIEAGCFPSGRTTR